MDSWEPGLVVTGSMARIARAYGRARGFFYLVAGLVLDCTSDRMVVNAEINVTLS